LSKTTAIGSSPVRGTKTTVPGSDHELALARGRVRLLLVLQAVQGLHQVRPEMGSPGRSTSGRA
jgi:hypothetical protein